MEIENNIYHQYSLSRIHSDWANLVGRDALSQDAYFAKSTTEFAKKIMDRVKHSIDLIIQHLTKIGYRFSFPNEVWIAPDHNVNQWLIELQNNGIYIPVSLQAFLMEIGTVNLMGSDTAWIKPAYIFDEMPQTNDVWYTDPLVVYASYQSIEMMFQDWKYRQDDSTEKRFLVEFSPDYIHKANLSGGVPYSIQADVPAVDSIVLFERKCVSFMEYVRNAVRWCGFPGFEYIHSGHAVIEQLRKNLQCSPA